MGWCFGEDRRPDPPRVTFYFGYCNEVYSRKDDDEV